MKFTSEDLMKAMGLQVGDRVKHLGIVWTVHYNDDLIHCIYLHTYYDEKWHRLNLFELFDKEYEILPKPKRVGDLKCGEKSCKTCPLRMIGCRNIATSTKNTLYQILEKYSKEYQDQEIYDLLKSRLDKVVQE